MMNKKKRYEIVAAYFEATCESDNGYKSLKWHRMFIVWDWHLEKRVLVEDCLNPFIKYTLHIKPPRIKENDLMKVLPYKMHLIEQVVTRLNYENDLYEQMLTSYSQCDG